MKKLIVVGALLGLSSMAFASGMAPMPAPMPNYFDGAYIGIGAGVQHTTGSITGQSADVAGLTGDANFLGTRLDLPFIGPIDVPAFTGTYNIFAGGANSYDNDSGITEPNADLFVGYGKTYNNFYVGGEVFGRYADTEIDNSGDHALFGGVQISGAAIVDINHGGVIGGVHDSIEVTSDWSYGGALRLGYLVSPKTMVYLLAGAEVTKFDNDVDHSVGVGYNYQDVNHKIYALSSSSDFNETRVGFMPGVGIETMLTDKLSLRAEYTYVDYGSYSGNSSTAVSKDLGSLGKVDPNSNYITGTKYADSGTSYEVDPSRGLFTLALAYHFNGL